MHFRHASSLLFAAHCPGLGIWHLYTQGCNVHEAKQAEA